MSERRRKTYLYISIALAVLMAATLFLPSLAPQHSVTQNIEPTEPPIPTFPPPVTNFDTISFDQTYFHPSGLFTISQPSGWLPTSPTNNGVQVQINLENRDALSVIEAYIEVPPQPVTNLQALNARFSDAILDAGWRRYSAWQETGRTIDTENDMVVIDFELSLGRQTYLARHVAWLEDNVIKVVRVVTPENARDLLLYMIDQVPQTLQVTNFFPDTPTQWTTFYDNVDLHIIRFPSSWRQVNGSAGRPVSIEGVNGETLRIETVANRSVNAEEEARAYLRAQRPDVTIASVQPVERDDASGFAVAYNTTTLEGTGISGLLVLLNDADDNTLHTANVSIRQGNLDLNAPENNAFATEAANVMATFQLTEGLNLPVPTPTATPTAEPTVAPEETGEVDPTPSGDATSDRTTTPEPTDETTTEDEETSDDSDGNTGDETATPTVELTATDESDSETDGDDEG